MIFSVYKKVKLHQQNEKDSRIYEFQNLFQVENSVYKVNDDSFI